MNFVNLLVAIQVCFPPPAQLQASDADTGALFGIAVDQDGDRIAVGADHRRPPSTILNTGAVYVFELVGASWVQQALLEPLPPPPIAGFDFGCSVALDGDVLAVGAAGASPQPGLVGGHGLVYVYRHSGGTWMQEAVLDPYAGVDEPKLISRFGDAVALEGHTLLVGMPSAPNGSGTSGRVYVYTKTPPGWSLQGVLHASDGEPGDSFGDALVLQGDTACIGARGADGAHASTGAVYVFARSGGVWTQQAKIVASDGSTGDQFGFSLALDADGLAVGAPFRPYAPLQPEGGGVYYFTRTGSTWQQQQFIRPADTNLFQLAGWSVALAGEHLVLGCPNQIFTSGYFHIYSRGSTGWTEHLKLAPAGAQGSDQVGRSLSLVGKRLVAGSYRFDTVQPDTGAAHVYELPDPPSQPSYYCTAKIDSTGCLPRIYHVGLPSVAAAAAGQPYTLRAWDLIPQTPAMVFYSNAGAASISFAGGILCLLPPVRRTQPVSTGGSATTPCHGQPAFDFNAWIAGGFDPALGPGQEVWLQYWYRDSGALPGQEVGLTSAIHVQICP